jgi:predicted RNA-binding protein with PIN domain
MERINRFTATSSQRAHAMTELTALPDHLIVPLLDSAAVTLRALPAADVPVALRPLLGFDRRGLTRGPARRQLRRALQDEAEFREQVVAAFCDLPEVRAALEGWRPENALALASTLAERDELALLASGLVAATPAGADFGLGVVCAVDAAHRAARGEQTEAVDVERRVGALEEGLRRVESERDELERARDELANQLRAERRARRGHDDRVTGAAARVELRVGELEGEVERERVRADRAVGEATRARVRVERAKDELVRERSRADRVDGERARASARVDALEVELRSLRSVSPPAPGAASRAPSAVERGATPGRAGRRARPNLPGGLVADSATGADALLRGGSVLLVVDGYNVSKTAWPDAASLAVERESLVRALHGLHLTSGVAVVVVFDGDGTPAFSKTNRPGVRVVFSPPGEEADSVVVETVSSTPLSTPVVVASSDRWVREHAETFGAVVVSAATLFAVLRRAPGG